MQIANTQTNTTTVHVHPSNDIVGNDGNSIGDSTIQLPVDHGMDVKGQSISVRVTTRPRDTSDGDSWCEDEFQLVENHRVERYCLIGLRSTVNTRLLTTEVEDQGPKVKAIRVFPIRRDPGRALVKLTLVANDNASLVLTDNFWPAYVRCLPWRSRETRREHKVPMNGSRNQRL
ncbi:hypothetical protein DPMN_027097 [Dreissena polymorpha]|uniref:Uncharacterized protein n=1 Tax=Dreissena polymorpha TaxID=45954 RepID=A0A9D4LSV2_DREPO|nr:hypothetical protein DPMN_027097 [Dreissena polymorpha]